MISVGAHRQITTQSRTVVYPHAVIIYNNHILEFCHGGEVVPGVALR